MSPRLDLSLLLALALGCGALHGQAPLPEATAQALAARAQDRALVSAVGSAFGTGLFRVPIHTQHGDEQGVPYGWWAAGDDYKVSFHDGFAFYPCLGKDYPDHLPLRWRTQRATIDGEALARFDGATTSHGDWRFELHHGALIEAYDVRPEGVEQSFVLRERPARIGELVVEGLLETPLAAPRVEAAHQALTFVDATGREIVRYGEAYAIDARGKKVAATTAFDGRVITLRVAAEWMAAAEFPVILDPLTSALTFDGGSGFPPEHPKIHREEETTSRNTMVTFMRPFTAGDYDVIARLATADLASSTTVFSDIAAGYSSLLPDVAYLAGSDCWAIGLWRHFPASDRVRVYFHDRGNLNLNSGPVDTSYNPLGEFASFPTIGGTDQANGTFGLLAYRMDPFFGNSETSAIHVIQVDGASRRMGAVRTIDGPDAEAPDLVTQMGLADDAWVLVYQQRDHAQDDYDIYAARVTPTLGLSPRVQLGPNDQGDKVRAVVQGRDGRYLCAMVQNAGAEIHGQNFGREVLVHRFDWIDNFRIPSLHDQRIVASAASQDLGNLHLAFDSSTRSHWCLSYTTHAFTAVAVEIRRLGATGGITEAHSLPTARYHAASSFDPASGSFQIVSCNNEAGVPLYAQLLRRPSDAASTTYGTSCGPAFVTSDTTPYAGLDEYRVILANAPPLQPAVLLVSAGAARLDLAGLGAPGCALLVLSPSTSLPVAIDSLGNAVQRFALPDAPVFLGDVHWQYLYVWPGAGTPLALGATQGLRTAVR